MTNEAIDAVKRINGDEVEYKPDVDVEFAGS